VCRDWEDRFLDASIDLMEACPEPENLYWGRDLCRRSILGAAHPLRPLFPNGAGQLVFQAACDVAERESGDPGLLCAFTLATETGYVNHVYTREDHRGRGLASAAIVRLFHSLAAVGHGRTTILTHDTNPGAIALYKRLGFEELFRYPQFFLRKT
jgi:GNAT superfamily N-acetyltransferase